MGRYVLTAFAYGTLLGPTQVAAHIRGQVSVHELSLAGNKHTTATKIDAASVDVIDNFNRLDVASVWGDGKSAAADGTQIDTWEDNLLAETSTRYGGYGGIAYRHVSNTYIALFPHFIPCGVWEAVYIIEGLLKNTSEIQPDTTHADTQGQSLPVFGLGALPGFDLLPRIRNWHDLVFFRPSETVRYSHIDSLFGDQAVDWKLIETHWSDLLRTAISIRENKLSSVTLLRRLGNHSRKNRLYRAFRELGRAIRTITLLRYLSEPALREQITAITNRTEAFHGFADWLMFGGKLIGHNDPDHQEKVVKFNELIANCVSLPSEVLHQFLDRRADLPRDRFTCPSSPLLTGLRSSGRGVEDEAVLDVARGQPVQCRVDLGDGQYLDGRGHVVGRAEVEHLLGVGDAAAARARQPFAPEPQGLRCEGQLRHDAERAQGPVEAERRQVGRQVVRAGHGVEDEVEPPALPGHGLGVGRDHHVVGAEVQHVLRLAG